MMQYSLASIMAEYELGKTMAILKADVWLRYYLNDWGFATHPKTLETLKTVK